MGKDLPEFEDKVIKGKKYPVAFAIRHFGTVVPYCIDGFCDKNADPLDKVMLELMQLCHDSDKATDFSRRLFEQPSSDRRSLAFKFRDEMDRLVQTLEKCSGHFVRCIKPNDERKAFVLDPKTCTPQLQSCGVLEAAKVAQAGFPHRIPYKEFLNMFLKSNALRSASWERLNETKRAKLAKAVVRRVLRCSEGTDYVLGRTKMFLCRGVWERCIERQRVLELVIGSAPERTDSGRLIPATGLRLWRLKRTMHTVVSTVEENLRDAIKRKGMQAQLAKHAAGEKERQLQAEREKEEQIERKIAAKVKDAVAQVEEAAFKNLQTELAAAREAKDAEVQRVRTEMGGQLRDLTEKALGPAKARLAQLEREIQDLKERNEELHECKAELEAMRAILGQVAGLTGRFAPKP